MIRWVFVLLLLPALAHADFSGTVVKVFDGDTITVLTDQHEEIKIRLHGIDAPEKAQAYADTAQQFAHNLVDGQTVTIIDHGKDRYNRIIGDVVFEDGRTLNRELVKAGLAWWYLKYSDDRDLGQLELNARLARVGLWKDKSSVSPWAYRQTVALLQQMIRVLKARNNELDENAAKVQDALQAINAWTNQSQ